MFACVCLGNLGDYGAFQSPNISIEPEYVYIGRVYVGNWGRA